MDVELSKKGVGTGIEEIAGYLKALGDPTRLRIYLCLADYDSVSVGCSGELSPTGMGMGDVCCRVTGAQKVSSTLSHHIKTLRTAGLVRVRREGRRMVCSLEPGPKDNLANLFDSVSPVEGNPL